MTNPLEKIGNLLDKVTEENKQLPNEFTRGQVEGVQRAWVALANKIDEIDNDPHFLKTPRVNPETNQMVKYGDIQYKDYGDVIERLDTIISLMKYGEVVAHNSEDPLYDDTLPERSVEEEAKGSEEFRRSLVNRPWDQSLGQRYLGIENEEKEFYDPETNLEGKTRNIGSRINVDDVKTVEEWENEGGAWPGPRVYTDNNKFNELEDLRPGE